MSDQMAEPPANNKAAISSLARYAVACVFMLTLSIYTITAYFNRLDSELLQRRQFKEQLQSLLKQATEDVGVSLEYYACTRPPEELARDPALLRDRDRCREFEREVRGTGLGDVFRRAKDTVLRAQEIVNDYKVDASASLSLDIIGRAYAQATNRTFSSEKIPFIWFAFALITSLMGFCLWTIGRPGAKDVDKRWAKQLLDRQFVFLGGVIGGILLK
jgi:hypothetical protein